MNFSFVKDILCTYVVFFVFVFHACDYTCDMYCRCICRYVISKPEVIYLHLLPFRQNNVYTVCSKKSDAKIEITITATNLIRIKYPLSIFNYHLSDANVANFNKIHCTVFEQQLFQQVAQLSQRDRAAGWVSYGQKWKTGTGRQYLRTI